MAKPQPRKHQIRAEVKNGKSYIRITTYLDNYGPASGQEIRANVDQAIAAGVTDCDVYITSHGGDVFEAVDIANELKRFSNVTLYAGAVIASAATYLAAKFRTIAKSNTQVMIHRPSLYTGGTVAEIESDLKLLRNVTEDYKAAYAAKTGKAPEEIEALWSSGDFWMTAAEALELGFIDAIEGEEAITPEDVVILQASAAPVIPKPVKTTTDTNSNKMDRTQLISALGLDANATDEQISEAVTANKQAADQARAHAAASAKAKKDAAKRLVAEALTGKKIVAAEVPHYEKLAEADYDSTKAALDARPAVTALSAHIQMPGRGATVVAAERKDWDLDKWLDEDPEGLKALKEEQPDVVAAMENRYFSKRK